MSLHLSSSSSSSPFNKVKLWLAEVSPRDSRQDRPGLKRVRSESPPPPPRIQSHHARSTYSACDIGRSDMAEIPKTPTPLANASKRARINVYESKGHSLTRSLTTLSTMILKTLEFSWLLVRMRLLPRSQKRCRPTTPAINVSPLKRT